MQRVQTFGPPLKAHLAQRRAVPSALSVRCSAVGGRPSMPLRNNPIVRLTATASAMVNGMMQRMKSAAAEASENVDEAQLNQQIKDSVKQMRMLAIVAPFAAVSGSADTFFIITKAVASFIKVSLRGHMVLCYNTLVNFSYLPVVSSPNLIFILFSFIFFCFSFACCSPGSLPLRGGSSSLGWLFVRSLTLISSCSLDWSPLSLVPLI